MSTFRGLVPELPGIAIDCFDEECRKHASVFFLSHCHMDHMSGLSSPHRLNGRLYASPMSATILNSLYPVNANVVRSLLVLENVLIEVNPLNGDEKYKMSVQALPADHCPGAVMLHFEMGNVRILYTGDFRPTLDTTTRLQRIKPTIVYLDSTFLRKDWPHFPRREESTTKIVELCQQWLNENPENLVSLWLPATYGSEDLLRQLFDNLCHPIHANDVQRAHYAAFPTMSAILTDDTAARIHICSGTTHSGNQLRCRGSTVKHNPFVRIIRPSAMRWRDLAPDSIFWTNKDDVYYVCYSAHASYGELSEVIRTLQVEPCSIRFNVLRDLADERKKKRLVSDILEIPTSMDLPYSSTASNETDSDGADNAVSFVPMLGPSTDHGGRNQTEKKENKSKRSLIISDDSSDNSDAADIPPKDPSNKKLKSSLVNTMLKSPMVSMSEGKPFSCLMQHSSSDSD